MSFTFIHAADIHLDSPFKGLSALPDQVRERLLSAAGQALSRMVDTALREGVDFVVIAGDVYDGAERSLRAQLALKKQLQRLSDAAIPVYIVHGNHDPLNGRQFALNWPEHVHFFGSERVEQHAFVRGGQQLACIYGISYAHAHVQDDLSAQFQKDTDAFAIGVLHTNCGHDKEHANYAPSTREGLLRTGMDYWALGHVHTRRIVHENPFIVYPGNMQGRHVKERGERGFYIVNVSDNGGTYPRVQLRFEEAADIVWIRHEIDFTGVATVSSALTCLEEERLRLRQLFPGQGVMAELVGKGSTKMAPELVEEQVAEELLREWIDAEQSRVHFVWPVSFSFKGHLPYEREVLRQGDGVVADLLALSERWQGGVDRQNEQNEPNEWAKALRSLAEHGRARLFLDEWSEEQQRDMIREAERLLITEWLKEEERR